LSFILEIGGNLKIQERRKVFFSSFTVSKSNLQKKYPLKRVKILIREVCKKEREDKFTTHHQQQSKPTQPKQLK